MLVYQRVLQKVMDVAGLLGDSQWFTSISLVAQSKFHFSYRLETTKIHDLDP